MASVVKKMYCSHSIDGWDIWSEPPERHGRFFDKTKFSPHDDCKSVSSGLHIENNAWRRCFPHLQRGDRQQFLIEIVSVYADGMIQFHFPRNTQGLIRFGESLPGVCVIKQIQSQYMFKYIDANDSVALFNTDIEFIAINFPSFNVHHKINIKLVCTSQGFKMYRVG